MAVTFIALSLNFYAAFAITSLCTITCWGDLEPAYYSCALKRHIHRRCVSGSICCLCHRPHRHKDLLAQEVMSITTLSGYPQRAHSQLCQWVYLLPVPSPPETQSPAWEVIPYQHISGEPNYSFQSTPIHGKNLKEGVLHANIIDNFYPCFPFNIYIHSL